MTSALGISDVTAIDGGVRIAVVLLLFALWAILQFGGRRRRDGGADPAGNLAGGDTYPWAGWAPPVFGLALGATMLLYARELATPLTALLTMLEPAGGPLVLVIGAGVIVGAARVLLRRWRPKTNRKG